MSDPNGPDQPDVHEDPTLHARPAITPHLKRHVEQAPPSNPPPEDYENVPVEELVRLARELTQRINNSDRQRLSQALKASGHYHLLATQGPILLQQFFAGEIDLDVELARRFALAPLMTSMTQFPKAPDAHHRHISANLTTQDGAASMAFDLHRHTSALEVTFTLASMLSFRFHLDVVPLEERQDWVELLHRTSGITFLWTNRRWEQDFLIFVVREHFARVYAFSAQRFEASARITLDTLDKLLAWFEKHWLVEDAKPAAPASAPATPSPDEALSSPPEEEAEDSGASFEW